MSTVETTSGAATAEMDTTRRWQRPLAGAVAMAVLAVFTVTSPAAGDDGGAPLPADADPDVEADASGGPESETSPGEASGDRYARMTPEAWQPEDGTDDAEVWGAAEDSSSNTEVGEDALAVRPNVRAAARHLPAVEIRGGGWGHGVGMSQYGAYAMAQNGFGPTGILTHYYPGTKVREDARPATRRVRAGIRTNQTASPIHTVDDPIQWYACAPQAGEETKRVPMDRCIEWFTQEPDVEARVVPFEEGVRVERRAAAESDPQPGTDPQWTVWKTTQRQVARAVHGNGEILAQGTSDVMRHYRFGWRDFHNLGVSERLSVVQDVDTVEQYLRGLAESPNSWGVNGEAALRAQAITGRTYALRRLDAPRGGLCACDLLSTPADQVFNGEDKVKDLFGAHWATAVERTKGLVLQYGDNLAETYYSSSHGLGRSENVEESWAYGTTAVPYLRSVEDPWSSHPDAGNPRSSWTARAGNDVLAQFVSAGADTPLAWVERLKILSRTEGKTPRTLQVTGVTIDGQRRTFEYDGMPQGSKPIAGASLRRYLPIDEGGTGGRLNSSQISKLSFGPFSDDDVHVHEFAISWAAHAGVVRGIDATTFAPNRAVSRAQMATYLMNTFDIPEATSSGTFSDVDEFDTHAASIEAVVEAGVARGIDDEHFAPRKKVTRAQMATFLAQALDLTTQTTGTFSDVDGGTHEASIEAIAEHGITTGCDAERFCPGDSVQRGQLASFLHRVVRE